MVDFYIRMNERGSDPYGSTKYFDKKHLKKFSFENEFLQVYGYYDKSKSKPLITETDLIFAAGDIYKRNDINADAGYAGILKEIKVNPANVSKYKGNYVVCRIDLLNKDIVILNSQLGMKHIYYSNTGNRVYAGNNLNLFRADFTAFNKNAVLQQLVFTFTITDETLLNGVYRLMPGEYAYSDGEEFSISRYFDIQNLILKDDTRAFDAEEFTHLFNRSIMERAHNGINVSFSGGFKGRTIVSSLINQAIKYKSYSFGIKGRDNTEIPLRISEELKINYESIYLDTEYENNYTECAKEAIYYSDGVSYNEKASHIFVYRKLAENDNSVLSGLAGEGIMEPVNFRKGCINLLYYYTVYLGRKINFHEYLKNTGVLRFLNHDFVSEVFGITELVREKFRDLSGFRLFDKGFMYYLYDLISTGFRMYQGTEIHNGRAYCENLTPYYDIDLIEYLFSTNYTEIYRNAFKDSKRYKSKGKTIYPVIIKMNYPDLNKYPVDEGYPPDFLLNPLKSFLIPFRYRNVNKGRHIRSEYEVNGLSRLLAMDFLKTCTNNQDIFNNDILKKECRLHSRGIVEDSDSLNRVLSLAVWMSGTL